MGKFAFGKKLFGWDTMYEDAYPLSRKDSTAHEAKRKDSGWKHMGAHQGVDRYEISSEHSHGGHTILETEASHIDEARSKFRAARSSKPTYGGERLQ